MSPVSFGFCNVSISVLPTSPHSNVVRHATAYSIYFATKTELSRSFYVK